MVTNWAERTYLSSSAPIKDKTSTLIINSLEFLFKGPPHGKNQFLSILENWVEIILSDERSIAGYQSHHTLITAAQKVLGAPNIRSKIDIAREIDRATNLHYSDRTKRTKLYQKIKSRYTNRSTPQQPTKPIGVSLSEDEEAALREIHESFNVYKQYAMEQCLEYAYALSKKGKKQVMSTAAPFLERGKCESITIRLSTTAQEKLLGLTRNLNKHQLNELMGRNKVSQSAALGLAIKLYAYDLGLVSNNSDASGYGDGTEVLTEEPPTDKEAPRKRDPGQSHYVSSGYSSDMTTPEDDMVEPISTHIENPSNSVAPVQEPRPILDKQPEALPLNPATSGASTNTTAASGQPLVYDQGQSLPTQHQAPPAQEQHVHDSAHIPGANLSKPTSNSPSNRSHSETKSISAYDLVIKLRKEKQEND